MLANGISCPFILNVSDLFFLHNSKVGLVFHTQRCCRFLVSQFHQYDSEWHTNLVVLKDRSNFRFCH